MKSTKYPSAYFLLGGDINDLNVNLLLNILSKFSQIVPRLTRGSKTLSVIVTDLSEYYQNPEITGLEIDQSHTHSPLVEIPQPIGCAI